MLTLVVYYGVIIYACVFDQISVKGVNQPGRNRPDFCNEDREANIDYSCFGQPKSYAFYPDTERCEEIPEGLCVTRRTFSTKKECVDSCLTGYDRDPSKALDICNVPRQERTRGACFNDWTIWAFYPDINRCAVLGFQGCMGDDYTFESEEDCKTSCSSAMNANRPEFCNIPRDKGKRDGCSTEKTTWTFYPETGDCEIIPRGGCLDHKNVFLNETECTSTCIPGLRSLEESILEGQKEEQAFYNRIGEALHQIIEDSKNGIKHIVLNENSKSKTIRHPESGDYYTSGRTHKWIIRNWDPKAVGFRIDTNHISLLRDFDHLLVQRDACHYPDEIKFATGNPLFIPGEEVDIIFKPLDYQVYTTPGGFDITVSAVYSLGEIACPGNQANFILDQNKRAVQIRHPESYESYAEDEKYAWRIKNENAGAAGFEVTFDEVYIKKCCDKIRVIGKDCNYGIHTLVKKSPLTIRGEYLDVTWTSSAMGHGPAFNMSIRSLEEITKTDCYEYTCDSSGRCVRGVYDDRLVWRAAQHVCKTNGDRLVIIRDQGMDDLVRSVIDTDYPDPYIGGSTDKTTWGQGETISDNGSQNEDTVDYRVAKNLKCGTYNPEKGYETKSCMYELPFICEQIFVKILDNRSLLKPL